MWLNQLSALAPCQCLTLAGMVITVPGVRLTAGLPSSWYQPSPAVQTSSWPAALGRVVDVPVVAAAGLKGNVGQKQTGFRVGQRVQERLANEKLGISGVCGTGAKNILLLKFMFIHALHTCCLLFFCVPALLCLTLRRWDTM